MSEITWFLELITPLLNGSWDLPFEWFLSLYLDSIRASSWLTYYNSAIFGDWCVLSSLKYDSTVLTDKAFLSFIATLCASWMFVSL